MIRAAAAGALLLISLCAAGQEACFSACHGAGGASATPLTPSLGGQPSFFVLAQLFLFREGRRDNELMNAAASGLSDAELQALAERIARLPPPGRPGAKPDPARYARGRAIAEKERCGNCHDADFSGHDNVPRLAHQREDYLLKALRDYKKGVRTGYGMAVMPETVSGLSDADLQDVAHFLAHFLSRTGR